MDHPQPVSLITGGAQGIGLAIAERFLRAQRAVIIADADAEAGREAVDALEPLGTCEYVEMDVSDEDDVRATVNSIVAKYGHLDHLVNNAAIACNRPITELALDDWRHVLDVNLTGAFLTVKHAAPALGRVRGSVVNIASTRAHMSEADTEAYSASKGGLVALTHALAISLGPQVRVNAISPGWIEVRDRKKASQRTEPELGPEDHAQHPAGRVGRPEDIAELALYLCSDKAGFITGQDFVVDGGMTKKMIYVE